LASPASSSRREIDQENERIVKWLEMLSSYDKFSTKKRDKVWPLRPVRMTLQFLERVYKGIPDAVRGEAWQVMSGSKAIMAQHLGQFQAPPPSAAP
jgi:hypothetical protein